MVHLIVEMVHLIVENGSFNSGKMVWVEPGKWFSCMGKMVWPPEKWSGNGPEIWSGKMVHGFGEMVHLIVENCSFNCGKWFI